ncbi:putative MAP kinase kinase kinase [Heracleum sosnowskyi]|uniref:MAP kinase kinase kinase n=1 Tax=Heracleum sosnowskyi TaxID=360622 RepID=A0AAD8IXC1_9APIA|nr:putative MAP kinase kinase kinase [Heracleum sosnowskyi]
MPKERRDRSVSFDRSRASPFPCGSSRSLLSLSKNPLDNEDVKEWESALCPFRKSSAERSETVEEEGAPVSLAQPSTDVAVPEATVNSSQAEVRREVSTGMHDNVDNQEKGKLVCPLCRGDVNGWMVVEPARIFMNSKSRSCACETCDFSGTYAELRKHARLVHPEVRPTEADPERQRDWRRLERQRDLGDLVSRLQSSIGEEMGEDSSFSLNENGLLTVIFLIRVFQPRRSSRSSSSRARAQVRRPTTRLWGESYDGESSYHDAESSDGGTGLRRSERLRLRRRATRRQQTPDES